MSKRVVIIPDSQLPYHDERRLRALIRFIGETQPDEVIHIGDVMDFPQPSRWSKGTAAEFEGDVYKDCERARKVFSEPLRDVYGGPVMIHEGNHDCADTATRAVTRGGLKHVDDLTMNDEVMSVDDEGRTIWQPITEIVRFPFRGKLWSYGGREISAVMTENHRVVGLNRDKSKWVEHTPATLPGNKLWAYTAGAGHDVDLLISDEEIRLAVWALTDSHRSADGRWTFYQSGQKADRIRILLKEWFTAVERARNRDITHIDGKVLKNKPQTQYEFSVGKSELIDSLVTNKSELPAWVFTLSERQVRVFFEEYVYTDGSRSSGGGDSFMLYVCREKLREDLQVLAASNGLRASSTEYRPGHFRLNVCSRLLSGIYREDAEQVDYDGEVWCLRVPNERFFVEREGRIHLTGNSRPRDYLAKYAPALSKSGEFNLDKLLDFQQYNFTLLPDFYQVAPGWLTTHGHRGGIRLTQKAGQTALGAAIRFGQSVVMGHTHRLGAASHSYGVGNNVSTLWGIEVGNLMDYRKAQYLNGAAPNWQKGFVILDVARTKVQPTLVDMKGRSFQVDGKEYEVV